MTFRSFISHFLLGLVVLIGLGSTSFSQLKSIRIYGTIVNKVVAKPLFGAMIRVKGEPIGASTDEEGHFSFSVPANRDSVNLVISAYDFVEQEKTIVFSKNPDQTEYELNFEFEDFDPGWLGTVVYINAWPDRVATSGEMDQVSSEETERGGMYSTEQALNGIPGVRFDSRGQGGSRRLSIRGSVIRSPFGVQNVRAYFDGAPLSSPDGSTPIEVLDVSNIESMSVSKGPQGDQFGPGSGGVLHVNSNGDAVKKTLGGSADFLAGSNGYFRWMAATGYAKDNKKVAVRYTGQQYAGYREQEANRKQMLFVSGSLMHKTHHTFRVSGWHYGGEWELPGALTATQAETDPRQAVPFSVDGDARVNRQRTRIIGQYQFQKSNTLVEVNMYGNRAAKINPYGTSAFFQGYKNETAGGAGGRSVFTQFFNRRILRFQARLQFGAEYQTEVTQAAEFDNDLGTQGSIRSFQRIRARQSLIFGGLRLHREFDRNNIHQLNLMAGLNQVYYSLMDRLQTNNIDLSASPGFKPAILPSLTYIYKRSTQKPYFKVQTRLSTGYSPPSIAELRRDDGSISTTVVPESSLGLEIRPAFFLQKLRIKAEFNVYAMQIRDAILPQQLPSTEYVYRNAGTTRQNGLEAFLTFNGPGDSQSNFRYQFNASGAIQDYRFSDYIKDSTDLSGNKLPGAPQATFSGSGSLQFKRRIDLLLSGRYNGRTWANDENTVAQDGYWLFDGQLSWHIYAENPAVYEPHPTPMITILVGMNNILDQQYTNFLALNAFGGRYWNPAPGRNVFGGVQFRF